MPLTKLLNVSIQKELENDIVQYNNFTDRKLSPRLETSKVLKFEDNFYKIVLQFQWKEDRGHEKVKVSPTLMRSNIILLLSYESILPLGFPEGLWPLWDEEAKGDGQVTFREPEGRTPSEWLSSGRRLGRLGLAAHITIWVIFVSSLTGSHCLSDMKKGPKGLWSKNNQTLGLLQPVLTLDPGGQRHPNPHKVPCLSLTSP